MLRAMRSDHGDFPKDIRVAVRRGDLAAVGHYARLGQINSGVEVSRIVSCYDDQPLHLRPICGRCRFFPCCIFSCCACTTSKCTPLYFALREKKSKIVKLLAEQNARLAVGKLVHTFDSWFCCGGMGYNLFADSSSRLLINLARKDKKKKGWAYTLLQQVVSQNKELIADYCCGIGAQTAVLAGCEQVKDRVCNELLRLNDRELLNDIMRKQLIPPALFACVAVEKHFPAETLDFIVGHSGEVRDALCARLCKLITASGSRVLIDFLLRNHPGSLRQLLEIAAVQRRDPDLVTYLLAKQP